MFVFWGVILLMTLVAVVWVLWARRNQQAVPLLVKWTMALLIPVLALVLYWNLGDSNALFQYWALNRQAKIVKSALLKIKNPQQVVDQLKTYLEHHPDSPQGWYLLGKLYYGQRDYAQAVLALKKAYQQAPHHLIYVVSYAQAAFFHQGRRLTPGVKALMLSVLKKDKNNVGALNLLAMNDYLQGRYRFAIQYWERLLPLFPAGSKDQRFLLSMISEAQKKEK